MKQVIVGILVGSLLVACQKRPSDTGEEKTVEAVQPQMTSKTVATASPKQGGAAGATGSTPQESQDTKSGSGLAHVGNPTGATTDAMKVAAGAQSFNPSKTVPFEIGILTLLKEDLVVGTGPSAKSGDRVQVHYTGRLLDGTVFDASKKRGMPFSFTLGQGSVIRGWDMGVVGMKRGGKRKLSVPAKLAYGKRGSPPKIPPNATLIFEIELLSIKAKR